MKEEEIKQYLKQAWTDLRTIQKEDRANCNVFLEELAIERAQQQNIQVESAIKQIQHAEAAMGIQALQQLVKIKIYIFLNFMYIPSLIH